MTKWIISLDESGTFDDKQKYFILAGIIYKIEDFEEVKNYFVPLVNKICEIIDEPELHSSKMGNGKRRFSRTALFSHIGMFDKVNPIVYVVYKEKVSIFKNKNYNKKSWKYNKVLDFLYQDLVNNKVIDKDDKVGFLIDNITLSEDEERNLKNWLPSKNQNVLFVETGCSKNFKFIQMADMIANFFSTNGECNLNAYDLQFLKPFIEFFPRRHKNEYLHKK